MNEHIIGEIFGLDEQYSERAKFCNDNNLMIVEITNENDNERKFQIQEIPKPSFEEHLQYLRTQRNSECFVIINRGRLWYDKLTEEQTQELNAWYQEWLDVTKKYKYEVDIDSIIPKKPKWLK